jgi:hypothetical protein
MGNLRCRYNLATSVQYTEFIEKVKDRKLFAGGIGSNPSTSLSYRIDSNLPEAQNLSGIMVIMFYKMNIITQAKGLEYTETNVLLITDLDQLSQINAEMVKYSTTEDIVGFSLNGKRNEEDYDTHFALYNTLKTTNKNDPLPSIIDGHLLLQNSDQYEPKRLSP